MIFNIFGFLTHPNAQFMAIQFIPSYAKLESLSNLWQSYVWIWSNFLGYFEEFHKTQKISLRNREALLTSLVHMCKETLLFHWREQYIFALMEGGYSPQSEIHKLHAGAQKY